MNIIAQMISTNAERPNLVIDTDKLTAPFKNKVEVAVQNNKSFLVCSFTEFEELHRAAIFKCFPILIDGVIEMVL